MMQSGQARSNDVAVPAITLLVPILVRALGRSTLFVVDLLIRAYEFEKETDPIL
jgi:hypothetical protein